MDYSNKWPEVIPFQNKKLKEFVRFLSAIGWVDLVFPLKFTMSKAKILEYQI